MQRCFHLAALGAGKVAPNPMVGALLVYDNRIISEGFHEKFGGPHAEVHCIGKVSDASLTGKSVLYVNLEPCSHHGKTPPCADLVIRSGIRHVVISNTDPNPLVAGRGINKLKEAGIHVETGILERQGAELNKRFFTFHRLKRPYIILKWAQTADGFIAPDPARRSEKTITWISNPESRVLVHQWRALEQSILVGANTVVHDDPKLTVREIRGRHPVRIVLDPELRVSEDHRVFSKNAPVIVFNTREESEKGHIKRVRIRKGKAFLTDALQYLYQNGIQSVIVEGGRHTLDSFVGAGLWDEARVFTSRSSLGSGITAPSFSLTPSDTVNAGDNVLSVYRNPNVI